MVMRNLQKTDYEVNLAMGLIPDLAAKPLIFLVWAGEPQRGG
jgi:hypothetical protein